MEMWTQTSETSGDGDNSSRSSSIVKVTSRSIPRHHNSLDITTPTIKTKQKLKAAGVSPRHRKNNGVEPSNNKAVDSSGIRLNLVCNGLNKGKTNNTTDGHRGRQGFRGKPVIKPPMASPRGNNQVAARVRESVSNAKSHSPSAKVNSGNDFKLVLTVDPLGGSATAQGHGQSQVKVASKSNDKVIHAERTEERVPSIEAHGRHCEACAVEYIKYCTKTLTNKSHPGQGVTSDSKDQHSVKSDSDARFFYEPLQLLRKEGKEEHNHMFSLMRDAKVSHDYRMRREPALLHTVSVPKRGIIKLTGLTYELDSPRYYDDRKQTCQHEQDKHAEEPYGPTLLPPSGHPHRGWLIKDRSMLKQVKHGEKRLLAEQEEQRKRELSNSAMLNTFIGGLLEYEIPEAPTLNSHLKKFVGVSVNNKNNENAPQIHKDKSNRASSLMHNNPTSLSPTLGPATTPTHSPEANKLPPTIVNSPRVAFFGLESYNPESLVNRKDKGTEQSGNNQVEEEFTLHQVLANAQKIHLSRIHDKHKSEGFAFTEPLSTS